MIPQLLRSFAGTIYSLSFRKSREELETEIQRLENRVWHLEGENHRLKTKLEAFYEVLDTPQSRLRFNSETALEKPDAFASLFVEDEE